MGGIASQQDKRKTPGFSAVWWVPPQKRTLTPKKPFERPRFCQVLNKRNLGEVTAELTVDRPSSIVDG
jgi:hypothetical protein